MNAWRVIGWGMALALLLLPAVAMIFTDEVKWSPMDFVFAAILLGAIGGLFELAVRRVQRPAYRAGVAFALLAGFLTIWVNAAVGFIGDVNPYNMLFFAVVPAALIGAGVVRGRTDALWRLMIATAAAQALLALVGMNWDWHGGLAAALLSGLWLVPAACFFQSARTTALPAC